MPPVVGTSVHGQTEALYLSHHNWLRDWLWSRLGCADRAADFAHDTFYRVLTRSHADRVEHPRAFLARIATRLLIDDGRRARLERAWLESQTLAAAEHPGAPSCETISELIDTLEQIARLLDGLADKPRRAFLMYRLDGVPQAEIAAELGVSVSMVKKYVAQGLLHCHLALRDEDSMIKSVSVCPST